jgi:DNA-binding IclR family transcriptional regulator
MSRPDPDDVPAPQSAVDGGAHQSIARIDLLLSALSREPEKGLRLAEVCAATGLGKATAHRLLSGLVTYRLVDHDAGSGRYFVGLKIFSWASGVGNRNGLIELVRPAMQRLVERFGDTVYLVVRSGEAAVCVERLEGSYPIKTLTLKVGDRRPLGIGAGSAAMLAALPEAERAAILAEGAAGRRAFPLSDQDLAAIVEEAAQQGHACIDGKIVPGVCTVGAAIRLDNGSPVAAISVSAVSGRMEPARRSEIARAVRAEIAGLREGGAAFFSAANRSRLMSGLAS